MSKLEQAFIKAYGKRSSQRAAPATPQGPHFAVPRPTAAFEPPKPGVAPLAAAAVAVVSAPQPGPPAPHIPTAQTTVERPNQPAHAVAAIKSAVAAPPAAPRPASLAMPPTSPGPAKSAAPFFRAEPAAQRVPAPHISTFTATAAAGVDGSLSVTASPSTAEQPPRIVEPIQPPSPARPSEVDLPRPVLAPESPVAPVQSPLPSSAAKSMPARPAVSRLRPLFEVDRLPWPPMCQSLARAASSDLAAAVDELLARSNRGEKLILFTSRHRGEGCTTTALCLTRLLAARGATCALVDADFAQGRMVRQLKLLPQAGWEQVLRDDLPLDEALVESMEDRVVVLPLQGPLADPQLLAQSARLAESLDRLRDEYALVVVDAGPLDDRAAGLDKLVGAAKFDAAIVIQDVRRASHGDLDHLAELRSIPRVEIAENFLKV